MAKNTIFVKRDKEVRVDPKRDKNSPKELRRLARRRKHIARDVEQDEV